MPTHCLVQPLIPYSNQIYFVYGDKLSLYKEFCCTDGDNHGSFKCKLGFMKAAIYIISNLRLFMEHYCSNVGVGISRFVLFNFVRNIVKVEEERVETERYKSESKYL